MKDQKERQPYVLVEKLDDYQIAWGCSKTEALYSVPNEHPHENRDCYEDNQWY